MIKLSPPEYATVQVERPVISENVKAFLARAQAVGRRVLGEEIVGSVTMFGVRVSNELEDQFDGDDELADVDDVLEPVYIDAPVASPIFKIASDDELSLVLFHRGVTRSSAKNGGIFRARRILEGSHTDRRNMVSDIEEQLQRSEIATLPIMTELRVTSLVHRLDPERTSVLCDRIDLVGEPGGSHVLGLFVSPSEIASRALHTQAKAIVERLEQEKSQLARQTSPWQITIPFARFPESVSDVDYAHLMQSLRDELLPVRLTLGEPRVTGS